ncbi:MAG: hypothetical protein IKM66_02045 [Clostridia bacterium]|nr:hypothetical protein [Clostridia bacterium]
MSKSLYELALDYDESIKKIQQIVVSVRKQIKDAEVKNDSYEVYSLSRKLEMLYEEIRDMKIVSEKLKNYYKEEKSEEDAA